MSFHILQCPNLTSGFSLRAMADSILAPFSPSASGFASIHPKMENGLEEIGIQSWRVTQGWGNAKASAGYHAYVGWVNGHRYSTCVDLSTSIGCTPEMKSRLVAAGFAPFFRLEGVWANNQHIHCVYVGDLPLLAGPLQQAYDYTNGKNGLVGHAALTGPLAPTDEERAVVAQAIKTRVPHIAVDVISPNGRDIDCYAFMERVRWSGQDKTRCEVRPLLEFFGARIIDQKHCLLSGGIKTVDFSVAEPRVSGQFLRGNIAQLLQCIGRSVKSFEMVENGSRAILKVA